MEQCKASNINHNLLVDILQTRQSYKLDRLCCNNPKREEGNRISLRDIVIPNKVILPYKETIECHYMFSNKYGRES